MTLSAPPPATTKGIAGDSVTLIFGYSADDLHGRVLAGSIEVAAAVDGAAVTPVIRVDEANGRGEISIVLRRESYPGPDEHLLAVTLSLGAGAAKFVLAETPSITTPFSFSLLSSAIAEDGTCGLGLLGLGARCRYRGSLQTMSMMETEPRMFFFRLLEAREVVNLENAPNPVDPFDTNVYNLEAVPVGQGYQIIRIYAPAQGPEIYDGATGSLDGATLLLAALLFLATGPVCGRRRGAGPCCAP